MPPGSELIMLVWLFLTSVALALPGGNGYHILPHQRRSLEARRIQYSTGKLQPFAPRTSNRVAKHVLEMHSFTGTPSSRKYLDLLDDSPLAPLSVSQDTSKIYNFRESVFMINVTYGSQWFFSVLDTGSADSWLVQQTFVCRNHSSPQKEVVPQSSCRFGRPYIEAPTFKPLEDQHFNISYIDGEFLNGPMGRENITLGGLTVREQEFGLINLAAWSGDGRSSGLTGLAFPSVTRAYPGTDPKKDVKGVSYKYDPLLTTMFKRNLTAPLFSIAVNRTEEGPGALALGGIPGQYIRHSDDWITTPMQYLKFARVSTDPSRPPDHQFYVIEAAGWDLPRKMVSRESARDLATLPQKLILDTGSTLTQLPPPLAAGINGGSAWDPPAWLDRTTDQWMVDCNAKPPKVGMKFSDEASGGANATKTVYFAPEDLLFKTGPKGQCVSGVQAGSASIAGGSFLKNVVAVFDVGAAEIRLAQRVRGN